MFDIWVGLFVAAVIQAAPIAITAVGASFSERTGVVNIGLEGMMLMGAFTAATVSYFTGSPYIGLIAAMFAGGLLALIHGIISISFRGNQIVVGVAINLFAIGFTAFMLRVLFPHSSGSTPVVNKLPHLFGVSILLFIIYILITGAHFFMYRTVTGLRMRAVGEHPLAADTVGVSVYKIRYFGVIISGIFAGIGGAYLSIGILSQFTKGMSAGRGFIALAAMIFGKWSPLGALGAALLFGYADAGQVLLQQHCGYISPQLIQMIPYILTLFALAGFVGKAVAPAASGKPYTQSE